MRPVISTARATPASMRLASTSSQQTLTWPEYLNLRHKRRLISTITSVPTTIAAFFGGAMYFGNLDMDPSQPIFGIEPMFVYGGAT
jgi:import inner membrane translocase subunit TIM23